MRLAPLPQYRKGLKGFGAKKYGAVTLPSSCSPKRLPGAQYLFALEPVFQGGAAAEAASGMPAGHSPVT
jgi:hypothetical protein